MSISRTGPILGWEVDEDAVIAEMERRIRSDLIAQKILEQFTAAGCDREAILWNLWGFRGMSGQDADAAKTAFARAKGSILALSSRLAKDADSIESVKREILGPLGFDVPGLDAAKLRSQADLLKMFGNRLLGDLGNKRVTSRQHHLDELAEHVKKHTGGPHFQELSDLINAVEVGDSAGSDDDKNKNRPWTAESVRKQLDRYIERERRMAEYWHARGD